MICTHFNCVWTFPFELPSGYCLFATGKVYLANWKDSLKLFLGHLINCAVITATMNTKILELLWLTLRKRNRTVAVDSFMDHGRLFNTCQWELSTTHIEGVLWNPLYELQCTIWQPEPGVNNSGFVTCTTTNNTTSLHLHQKLLVLGISHIGCVKEGLSFSVASTFPYRS